jgi:hypothetical protein
MTQRPAEIKNSDSPAMTRDWERDLWRLIPVDASVKTSA